MTFLEFVYRKYLGPPASGICYRCPYCAHPSPSVTINPPKEGMAVKFRCHRCKSFGDEFDVLKLAGVRDYGDRRLQVAELRKEYESLLQPGAAPTSRSTKHQHPPLLPRGVGSVAPEHDRQALELAYADLTGDEISQLAAALALAQERFPADPEELMKYCLGMIQWIAETDAQHLVS